jgi:AraC-like DNA-binding protein
MTKIEATRQALATLAPLISAVLIRHGLAKATAGFPHPTATSSMSDWFSKLEEHLVQVCASAQDERTARITERIHAINSYISANLSDRNFSMEMAADHFGMSPAPFYHFYRDNAKESFADHLERARISEACRILADGNLQIKELISMVGFANDSTFRRAFRRVMGMLPHEYRPIP